MLNFSKHADIRRLKAMIINNRVFPYHLHEPDVFWHQDRYKKLPWKCPCVPQSRLSLANHGSEVFNIIAATSCYVFCKKSQHSYSLHMKDWKEIQIWKRRLMCSWHGCTREQHHVTGLGKAKPNLYTFNNISSPLSHHRLQIKCKHDVFVMFTLRA